MKIIARKEPTQRDTIKSRSTPKLPGRTATRRVVSTSPTRPTRGAAMVEAAVIIPVFLSVVYGIIYISLLISVQGLADHAAHSALTYLSTSDKLESSDAPGGSTNAEAFCRLESNGAIPFCIGLREAREVATQVATAAFIAENAQAPSHVAYLISGIDSEPVSIRWPSDNRAATVSYLETLQENTIGVTLRVRVRTFIPIPGLQEVELIGSAAGFRETKSDLSLANPTDCWGNPYGSLDYNTRPCDCVPSDPRQPRNMMWDAESSTCKYCPGTATVVPMDVPNSVSMWQVGVHSSWQPMTQRENGFPMYCVGGNATTTGVANQAACDAVGGRTYFVLDEGKCAIPTQNTCTALLPGSVTGYVGDTRGACVCYNGLTATAEGPDGRPTACVCNSERIDNSDMYGFIPPISAPNGSFRPLTYANPPGSNGQGTDPNRCACTGTLVISSDYGSVAAGTYTTGLTDDFCRALYRDPRARRDVGSTGCGCAWNNQVCADTRTPPSGDPNAVISQMWRSWVVDPVDSACGCVRPGLNWVGASGGTAGTRGETGFGRQNIVGTGSYGPHQEHWTFIPTNPNDPLGSGTCGCGSSPCGDPNARRDESNNCACDCTPPYIRATGNDFRCVCPRNANADCSCPAERDLSGDGTACLRRDGVVD